MGSRSKARAKSHQEHVTTPGRLFTKQRFYWSRSQRTFLEGHREPTATEAIEDVLAEIAHERVERVRVDLINANPNMAPGPLKRMVTTRTRNQRRRDRQKSARRVSASNKYSDPRQLWLKVRELIRASAVVAA